MCLYLQPRKPSIQLFWGAIRAHEDLEEMRNEPGLGLKTVTAQLSICIVVSSRRKLNLGPVTADGGVISLVLGRPEAQRHSDV
jgi:hypothetical protein